MNIKLIQPLILAALTVSLPALSFPAMAMKISINGKLDNKNLQKILESPKFLDICNLSLVNNESHLFKTMLENLPKIKNLKNLYISYNHITDEGAKLISQNMPNAQNLHTLIICYSDISKEGAKELSRALKYTPKLTTLILSGNNIGTEGAKELSNALKYLPDLTVLDISGNSIGEEGIKDISHSLKYVPKLENLIVNNCNIGPVGAKTLCEDVKKYLPELKALVMNYNKIDDESIHYIETSLDNRKWENFQIGNFNSLKDYTPPVLHHQSIKAHKETYNL